MPNKEEKNSVYGEAAQDINSEYVSQDIATQARTDVLATFPKDLGASAWTMALDTIEARDRLFNALSADAAKLSSVIGKTILVEDVYFENVESVDDDTGELGRFTMILLFTTDGAVYRCGSSGILSSLRRAFALYGPPTWHGGLKFEVIQTETPKGRTFNLKRVA